MYNFSISIHLIVAVICLWLALGVGGMYLLGEYIGITSKGTSDSLPKLNNTRADSINLILALIVASICGIFPLIILVVLSLVSWYERWGNVSKN